MKELEAILGSISNWVWGPPMLILLVGTHIFLTFRLKIIQRYLGTAIKLSFKRTKEGKGDVSQFGALTTALAATIGTGNIVGVATAIAAGGPGAVLWMWLTGVFGIATKYSEAVLSVKYRITTEQGMMAGGPMYVLERGMNKKWLGAVFAALTAVAAFGIGNMVQANSISTLVHETFQRFTLDYRHYHDTLYSGCDFRRNQIDRHSLRKARSIHGRFLCNRVRDFIDNEIFNDS